MKIYSNKIKCNFCGDVIESKHRHDFETCKCGRVSVDGGHDYLRRCFKEEGDYEELSEYEELPILCIIHFNTSIFKFDLLCQQS